MFATCPAVEGATCVADYCGGCNDRWILGVEEVTPQCKGKRVLLGKDSPL